MQLAKENKRKHHDLQQIYVPLVSVNFTLNARGAPGVLADDSTTGTQLTKETGDPGFNIFILMRAFSPTHRQPGLAWCGKTPVVFRWYPQSMRPLLLF